MKTTNLLVASAVIVFTAATGVSMAQQEGMPQRERTAPAEKMAPPNAPRMHSQGPSGPVGEAPSNRSRTENGGQTPRSAEQERSRSEQPRREQERTTGQAPREDRQSSGSQRDRTTGQAPRDDRTYAPSQQNKVEQDREKVDRGAGNRETTGQGTAGTRSYSLTPETRTRIHEFIAREPNAPRVNSPRFEVTVGTRVPRDVRFVALPPTVVELQPAWRGFEYFLIGDQMVVINPRTMEIVAVIDA
jgi:Protein of unknown function (DUF1236)